MAGAADRSCASQGNAQLGRSSSGARKSLGKGKATAPRGAGSLLLSTVAHAGYKVC